jgi:hypothetical protein
VAEPLARVEAIAGLHARQWENGGAMRIKPLIGLVAAALVVALGILFELVHNFEIIDHITPEPVKRMLTDKVVGMLLLAAIVLLGYLWYEFLHHRETEAVPVGPVSNTATATGNIFEQHQHFHLPDYPLGDFAKALATELKSGAAEKFSAVNATEQTQVRLIPGDGFIQLENWEFQVQAVTQQVGHTVSIKYWYANRGGLPVYEVQSWGLLVILNPEKNSGPHLKSLMLASAKDGHQKYPGGATLGVQQTAFAFAPLPEPFTEMQIDALSSQREALFFLVCGVWKDNSDQPHYWSECRKALLPTTLSVEGMNWLNL